MMLKKSIGILSISITVFSFFIASANGIEVLEPGYITETYVAYNCEGTNYSPVGMTFDANGNLYLSHWIAYPTDGEIYRVSKDLEVTKWVDDLMTPRRMVWTSGTSYGEYLYVTDPDKVLQIDNSGNATTFCQISTGPHSLALDTTGSYGGLLYTATRVQDQIYSISDTGVVSKFSSFPGNMTNGHYDLCFDTTGNYGGLMYAAIETDYSATGGIYSIDTNGTAKKLAPDILTAYVVLIDPCGLFENQLFSSGKTSFDNPNYTIWQVYPDGEISEFAKGTYGTGEIRVFAFGPDGAMYVPEFIPEDETMVITRIVPLPLIKPIEDAITNKLDILSQIDATIDIEWQVYDSIIEMLASTDYDCQRKFELTRSLHQIRMSIRREHMAAYSIERSIDDLRRAIDLIDEQNPNPPCPNQKKR